MSGSRFFRYLRYYGFGVRLGIVNLLKHGFVMGPKKTLGKILQPINSFSRYPEYDLFLCRLVQQLPAGRRARVLDVGSPKLMGIYLAYHYDVLVVMTDIGDQHLREYRFLWDGVRRSARGRLLFRVVDARRIEYADELFDAVYAMSVVEHIESIHGDRVAVGEMRRVLKKSGVLMVSVPVGSQYVEQYRRGFSYTEETAGRNTEYFFQRIYDWETLPVGRGEPQATVGDVVQNVMLVGRRACGLLRLYLRLGDTARGLLGFLGPVLACIFCRVSGEYNAWQGGDCERYGREYRKDDIYADLFVEEAK